MGISEIFTLYSKGHWWTILLINNSGRTNECFWYFFSTLHTDVWFLRISWVASWQLVCWLRLLQNLVLTVNIFWIGSRIYFLYYNLISISITLIHAVWKLSIIGNVMLRISIICLFSLTLPLAASEVKCITANSECQKSCFSNKN